MKFKKTFQIIGIISTAVFVANFFSWIIWGISDIPDIVVECITDCVYETPDSTYIYLIPDSKLNLFQGSVESFSDKDKKKFEDYLGVLFYNRPQKYLKENDFHNNGYGILKPVFYFRFMRIIPFYLSIDSGVYFGENSLEKEWKGIWLFGWLIKSNYVIGGA